MADFDRSGFAAFDRLLGLVRRTHELLDAVAAAGELPGGGADFLAETTLPHIDHVQAGFQGWLRPDTAGVAELRYIVRLGGAHRVEEPTTDAERLAAAIEATNGRRSLTGAADQPRLQNAEPWDLAALEHARVVLAMLPRLPETDVRYPGRRRSYADIPIPRGPAELVGRIEELERQLWRAATGTAAPQVDPGFRRTYGFFDAADRLGYRAFLPAA